MRKFLAMICALCLTASFTLAEETAVAYVNGVAVTASDLEARLQTTQILNQYSGETLSEEQKAARDQSARSAALNELIAEAALLQEAEGRGITLADEQIRADADARYAKMLATVENYVLASYPTLSGDELNAQTDSLLNAVGATRESYRHTAENAALLSALDEQLMQELSEPTEAEISARYDELYLEQKQLFGENENELEAALLQNKIVVYRPVELKLIRKAEFRFEDEAIALIRQTAAVSEKTAQQMRDDQHGLLEPTVTATYLALASGERDFADVLAELGQSDAVNYFHASSTRFGEDYYRCADAFATVGEVSEPYKLPYGYAILFYAGDLPACEQVPLGEVRDALAAELTGERSADALAQKKAELVADAEVQIIE